MVDGEIIKDRLVKIASFMTFQHFKHIILSIIMGIKFICWLVAI